MAQVNPTLIQWVTDLDHVALFLPPTAPSPEPARRIPFWKGLLFHWLVPGRLGPHLVVDTWTRAFAAHTLSVLLGLSVAWHLGTRSSGGLLRDLTSAQELRLILVGGLLDLVTQGSYLSLNTARAMIALFVVVVIAVAPACLACLLIPWCADGDNGKSAARRGFKSAYWATTILIPASAVYWTACGLMPPTLNPLAQAYGQHLLSPLPVALMLLLLGLFIRTLLVGGRRYVGQPTGPGFSPREPLCDHCGYRITGLPLTGLCPECGTPVRDSLPGGRRRPSPCHQPGFTARGVLELAHMQGRILRDPGFFNTLAVYQGQRAAWHFWWGTFLLMTLVSLASSAVTQTLVSPLIESRSDPEDAWSRAMLVVGLALGLPWLLHLSLVVVACQYAECWLKMTDYRVVVTVCYYASPLLWPLLFVGIAALSASSARLAERLAEAATVPLLDQLLTAAGLIDAVLWLAALGASCFTLGRLRRALRAVRYANV
ncbi:MAG TPA: hypothetical protein PKY77_14630 [Phycisphaerae bacterium]|nr:hypothetical protein [Phycisphaerae bacterium]HRY67491.1 hypothetical protein [Phycisphaerae bacterium]HSA27916.1 hypothetical protein [Phycisphaerae bacterium]